MSDLIERLRSQDVVDFTPAEIDDLTDEAASVLQAATARIAQLEADLSFQNQVTDAARQHQAELLERAEQAETRIAALESQIAAAEKQEPVGVAGNMPGTEGFTMAAFKAADVPVGTNLYARPLPSAAEGLRKDAERLYEILMCQNIEITDEAYLSLRVVGVPPSEVEFASAIDAALAQQEKP